MKKRDAAYKPARTSGLVSEYNHFKTLRALAKNALDTAKNKFLAKRLDEAVDSEGKWRELRRMHVSDVALLPFHLSVLLC